ncbi:MAG: immune inhibitor A [candidate division WOR-3 bacterium]|nr:MAG: immune inhibitor A [candidate division WOR-3 bacterium]
MRRIFFLFIILTVWASAQEMVVRVYAPTWHDMEKVSIKYDFSIVGARAGEYYDLVVDSDGFNRISGSGLYYEIIEHDLAAAKERVRAEYLSYAEIEDSLRQLAQDYPSLCKFDSLPITTQNGNWIYGIKISDNPYLEEADEPGFLIDGTHHSNEWACVPVIMFFVDSMLSAYGSVSEITEIVDNTEIYCFPVINVDGYLYDYPAGYYWRKNREPFAGSIGNDPNRNYRGCSPDIEGDWGAVDEGQASHRPSYTTFCGAYAGSGDEIRSLTYFVEEHIVNAYMSYHSSGEVIMWPWGWTDEGLPDSLLHGQVGDYMADQVQRLYGGTYDSGPIYSAIYPVSGSSVDWFYSWSHWVGGVSMLSFTTELGTSQYQPVSQLDQMVHQNFKALKYLAGFCDSIVLLLEAVVPPPDVYEPGNVGSNYTVAWSARNPGDNHPTHWELLELNGPSIVEDDLENGADRWFLDGFILDTTQVHSGTFSLFSRSYDNMNNAVQTLHPYLVEAGDSVTFWCWYDLETNYDAAVVEVSENTLEWYNLDTTRFNGSSGGWTRKAYSLEDWAGTSLYIRFRAMTDGSILNSGFYVDDIYPVCLFGAVDTVSSSIDDTLYTFTDHAGGEFFYLVRGSNTSWGWGAYSCLARAEVSLDIDEGDVAGLLRITPSIVLVQNPSTDRVQINYTLNHGSRNVSLRIYDSSGRLVTDLSGRLSDVGHPSSVIWDCRDENGSMVPNGIYFLRFTADDTKLVVKAVIMR